MKSVHICRVSLFCWFLLHSSWYQLPFLYTLKHLKSMKKVNFYEGSRRVSQGQKGFLQFSEGLDICQDSLESPWLCSNDHRKCSSQISENGSGAVKLLLLWFRTISQAGAITGPMMGQSVASKAATLKLFWSVMTSAHRRITRFPPNPLTRWLSVCECTHVCPLPSVQLFI